jgi:hypothetical protein
MEDAITMRQASCGCGQLKIECDGEPVRISICHCLDCQRRTGSVFGTQARFPKEQIVKISGQSSTFTRRADSGNTVKTYFCPACGSTVYWELSGYPDVIAVAVGAFADASFPSPKFSVYEARKHSWVRPPDGPDVQHLD